jgi:arylsulfatase A-like enzyme
MGLLCGALKSMFLIISNEYIPQKMYYLSLSWIASLISRYVLIALVVAGLALIFLIVAEALLKFTGVNRRHSDVIVKGVIPAFLCSIVGGYWLNKEYLPGFYELESVIGNAVWVVACAIIGWLIWRISQTNFGSYLSMYKLKILLPIIFLVVVFNGARYIYFLSLQSSVRPNVILISIDTLRADHLSCYGYNRNTSPNIDRFAKDGVLFSNVIAQSSWTLPSHMSMLTGLYPTSHGVLSKYTRLDNEILTLGEILQNAGYETGAITDGGLVSQKYGYHGFHLFEDKGSDFKTRDRIERTHAKAVTWLRKSRSNPFFLFLHTYQVHAPYDPLSGYDIYSDRRYGGVVGSPTHKLARDYDTIKKTMKVEDYQYLIDKYNGEIYYTDHFLGKLFEELRDLELYDNGIIVLTSDHGENFLDHRAYDIGHLELYDEVVKVPLIIKASDFSKSQVITVQVESIDIMPTVLELLGISIPIKVDGVSLLKLVKDSSYDGEFALSERDYYYKMIRNKNWKLLHRSASELELFDLISDPDEQHNLYPEKMEIAKPMLETLKNLTDELRERTEINPSENAIELDRDLTNQLKALGYIN